MGTPSLILEISDAERWLPFRGCRRIADFSRPSVLHPSRAVAEAEALRLSAAHLDRTFAVFEMAVAATSVKVPTHITLGGKVLAERHISSLVEVGEAYDLIPF
jgi:hypothetical protein